MDNLRVVESIFVFKKLMNSCVTTINKLSFDSIW